MPFLHEMHGYYYIQIHTSEGHKTLQSLGKVSKEEAEQALLNFNLTWKPRKRIKMPSGKFDVIYADPPWQYDFSKSDSRAIESHYPSMELQDICNLKVPSNKDCILYLWATAPKNAEGLKVMDSWGFKYKTNFVWVKDKIGMGYYGRGKHELLLIGTKGKISPPKPQERFQSVINASRGEHSEKPDIVYSIIEEAYPPTEFKLLELFARKKREGWEAWGDDVEN